MKSVAESKNGILLDLGCGANKQGENWVGLDRRKLQGVDHVHDLEVFPYPIESDSCLTIVASHVAEHIRPTSIDARIIGLFNLLVQKGIITAEEIFRFCGEVNDEPVFIRFMNECWRMLKDGGRFAIGVPYGRSDGMLQDPTHINFINEATWQYFSPEHGLFYIYRPLPWKIIQNTWMQTGNMEVLLEKVTTFKDLMTNTTIEGVTFKKHYQLQEGTV